MLDGGYHFDGQKEVTSLRRPEVEDAVRRIRDSGVRNIVVSGIFSPVNSSQEEQVGLSVNAEI